MGRAGATGEILLGISTCISLFLIKIRIINS